jgi:hypothetical protein
MLIRVVYHEEYRQKLKKKTGISVICQTGKLQLRHMTVTRLAISSYGTAINP